MSTHKYVCPDCGKPMANTVEDDDNQYDFSKRECSNCKENVEPTFDIDSHKYVCPNCRRPM